MLLPRRAVSRVIKGLKAVSALNTQQLACLALLELAMDSTPQTPALRVLNRRQHSEPQATSRELSGHGDPTEGPGCGSSAG
jgi:hypothetical protein